MKINLIIETNAQGEHKIDSAESYYLLAEKRVRELKSLASTYKTGHSATYRKYDLSNVDLSELLKKPVGK